MQRWPLVFLRKADAASDLGDREKRICVKPNILAVQKALNGAVDHAEFVEISDSN